MIAVPTSVGYGASFGGVAALLTMLNSCSAGVAVVNIDAGFKAGYIAARIVAKTSIQTTAGQRPGWRLGGATGPLPSGSDGGYGGVIGSALSVDGAGRGRRVAGHGIVGAIGGVARFDARGSLAAPPVGGGFIAAPPLTTRAADGDFHPILIGRTFAGSGRLRRVRLVGRLRLWGTSSPLCGTGDETLRAKEPSDGSSHPASWASPRAKRRGRPGCVCHASGGLVAAVPKPVKPTDNRGSSARGRLNGVKRALFRLRSRGGGRAA